MKTKTVHGFKVEYIAAYRTGKSQYQGAFIYQIEVLVDDEREVRTESNCNSTKEAKQNFEWSLSFRRERIAKDALTASDFPVPVSESDAAATATMTKFNA
jgi:hypothetical protein